MNYYFRRGGASYSEKCKTPYLGNRMAYLRNKAPYSGIKSPYVNLRRLVQLKTPYSNFRRLISIEDALFPFADALFILFKTAYCILKRLIYI